MHIQIVLPTEGAAGDDILAYMAARLLVHNGVPINFVSNAEPENQVLAQVGFEDGDCAEVSLPKALGDPPDSGGQYLFIGRGRSVTEIIEGIKYTAATTKDVTVVWVVPLQRVSGVLEQLGDLLCDCITAHLYGVAVDGSHFVFTPQNGVQFRVARSTLSQSLTVVLDDLQDLDLV